MTHADRRAPRRTRRFGTPLVAIGCLAAVSAVTPAAANDWPFWRGPEQTGATREHAVVTEWSPGGKNVLWKLPFGGRSTPIIIDGRVFAVSPIGRGVELGEQVFCADLETGEVLWQHRFNVFHTDIVGNRLGWTALVGDVETGYVYAHGTGGEFFCFDRDGKVVWKHAMTESLGRISGYGGRLHTPILDEDRVIVSFLNSSWADQARPTHRYVAFHKKTGEILWWAAPGGPPLDTTYSVPVVTVINGRRLLIAATADGNVYGMLARTGRRIWTFRLSKRGINSSVVVDGKYAYVCHSEENIDNTAMGRVVCIDASKEGDITETGEVWRSDAMTVGYASPAIANGRLYVINNSANLYCLDAGTGEQIWEHSLGRVMKGSPLVTADGVIYVGEVNGRFLILRDTGKACEELDVKEFEAADGNVVVEINGTPAISGGRVVFMTRDETCCIGVRGKKPRTDPIPPMPSESAADSSKPAELLVTPAEVTIGPGQKAKFTARTYDAGGHLIDTVSAHWSVAGAKGTIQSDGTFAADDANDFSAGQVAAKAGELSATARVRISPDLPIREDFESIPVGQVPPGWVGVVAKTRVIERDGSKVLQKLAEKPSPPFMRIRVYARPPIAGGYTVQADVLGTPKGKRFRPDMGLINSRYKLILMGNARRLRLVTWSPVPRLQKDVSFKWDTDTWYRMKFQVLLQADDALVRGKVWPRDEAEPNEWSIEMVDPQPNREGSPGIYGYSPGTTTKSKGPKVFYDNFQVSAND